MNNIIVKYQRAKDGRGFLDAQFCPQQRDVEKAVEKFLQSYLTNRPKEDERTEEELIKGIILHRGFYVEQENGDCEQISFESL